MPNASTESIPSQQPSRVPRSLDIDRTRQGLPSPRSWTSHDSKDGLMGSPSPTQIQHPSNPTSPVRRKAVRSSQTMASSKVPSSPRPATESDIPTQNRSPLLKSPSPVEDEDARLLATSVVRRDTPPQQMTQLHAGPRLEPAKYNASKEESLDRINSSFTTATASRPSISLTALDQQSSSRQPSAGDGKASLADRNGNLQDGEGDRNKQAVMQREKQEAQLATHRQTMMKVVGESSRGPSSNTDQSGRLTSMSSPELSRLSHLTVGTGVSGHSGKSSGPDDDDEDVPLGILAAHGFPSRNKPPARLQTQLSNLNVSRGSLPMSAPPASVAGESRAGSRGTLPVFARNLPQDPYYGASPLNSAGRGQLSMAGSSLGGVPPGQVHPSGLVGVIAGEERARAMRRGSPNQQINDGLMPGQNPGMMARSQTMGAFPGPAMPGMMSPQYLSPGDQAQIQMAQQMTQMMQIQMQWMQQMAQMQHNGQLGQMPPMPMPNFVGMPGEMGNPIQRPFSMPVPEGPGQTGRAMSMAPGMGNQWNRKSTYAPSMTSGKAGYAPSIAPSERSTIGLASRYRPVSTIAESSKPPPNRASTFTSSTLLPWSEGDEQGRLSPSNTNITVRPPSSSGLGQKPTKADDEDDDQGWADMKRKRDKKKGMWKMKKSEK